MEPTNVPRYLKEVNKKQLLPFTLNLEHSLYFVEDIALSASHRDNTIFSYWQKKLFVSLFESTSGTLAALDYFKLPRSQTVTIGAYVDF